MRSLIPIIIIMLGSSSQVVADTIPADNPYIEYTGRIDFSDKSAPVFSYSGVSVRANFTGTSLAILLNDNVGQNYYSFILDGQLLDPVNVKLGKKAYQIASGLKDTIHEVEIFKRTEQQFGKTTFYGFIVPQGDSLVPIITIRHRLIEYIGNSITCGYGNEGVNGGTFGPTTENHYFTYAAFTSRNFNARHLAVCKSGIGIYRNYNGPITGNADCMTNYYSRIFLYDEYPKFGFSETPDLICIDLGTNDFSTTGGDSALWVSNYFRLIDTLQTRYTNPDILCLLGPMMGDPSLSKVRTYLQFIADSASKTGKGKVYFFEMSQQTGSLGIGIDWHPTVAQHMKNAGELTQYISTLKKWKITPLPLSAQLITGISLQVEFNTPLIDSMNYAGFRVYSDDIQYPVNAITTDPTNNKILQISLGKAVTPGEKIYLDYTPGSITSIDSLSVGEIHAFNIKNNLTATKIVSSETSTNGGKIILTANKNLKKNSSLDGLSVYRSQGPVVIHSFSITNKLVNIFLESQLEREDTVWTDYTGSGLVGMDEIPLELYSGLLVKNNSTIQTLTEKNFVNELKLFPNPTPSGINYSLARQLNMHDFQLEVMDITGKFCFNQVLTKEQGKVEFGDNYSAGQYIFRFIFSDTTFTKTVIKN